MKYAVPISGGMVSLHFGHCEQFAFYEVDEEAKAILSEETVSSPGHQPGFLPGWLAQNGVSVIIAGGMGSRARDLFASNGIRVIANTLEADPKKAIMDYLNGSLQTGGEVCDH